MGFDKLLLLIVLALWIVCLGIMFAPQEVDRSDVHPQFSSLEYVADASKDSTRLFWGWGFGVLIFCCFAVLIALGAAQRDRLQGGIGRWILVGLVLCVASWTWLMISYASYRDDPAEGLWMGLPAPTAVLLMVLFPVSSVFNVLFVVLFRQSVYSANADAAFEQMMASRSSDDQRSGSPSPQ